MVAIFGIIKVITTVFLAFASYCFFRALWKSKSNVDLVGNGFSLTFMVLAIMFMWIGR